MTGLVAIVDDDAAVRRALRRLLISLDYEPALFASGEAFLADAPARPPACALIDLHMPGLDGIEVLGRLASAGIAAPAIIITGHDQVGQQDRCLASGARDYLVKPLERAALARAIADALR